MDGGGSVELLERALAYTRVRLADVRPELLDRPTPCAGWDLGDLLAHMEDSLDAFLEAAGGSVTLAAVPSAQLTRIGALSEKACALLGAWTHGPPATVHVGPRALGSELLGATAALEITVHGWDVGVATGHPTPVPADLAARLLAVAREVVTDADRGSRFADPLAVPPGAPYDVRLLAFLGR